jgi:hypothetical protein
VTDKTERLGDWRLGKLQAFFKKILFAPKRLENYNISKKKNQDIF